MNRPYILVEAYPGDLSYEVTKRVEEGYVPVGGPFQGRKGISEHYLQQAMFNERYVEIKRSPVGLKLPTSQELDEAVLEANAAHPGSASSGPYVFANAVEEDQWKRDAHEVREALANGKEAFVARNEGSAQAVLNAAYRMFRHRVDALRKLQQTPYVMHQDPTSNEHRFDMLAQYTHCSAGVMAEIAAGKRARDPKGLYSIPAITVSLRDAQLIDALLESNHAQYPTEHQEAVLRFKRAVHGTQES